MNELTDLFKLSTAERIQLAENLWDSVAADPEALPPLTEAERVEVEQRLASHVQKPESAAAWNDVRARLWSRLG